jgi:hypothetical protein
MNQVIPDASVRVEWAVLERPTMAVTLETSQRVIPVRSESDARNAVATKPFVYVGVVSRTVADWVES